METINLTAREVRPGDILLRNNDDEALTVYTAATFGKKSQTTTITTRPFDPAPMHMDPETKLRVRRAD